ncbi:MAG TPA: type IV secretory system conjugative DNA transfer family protein [Acidimicrobiales bacterium]|nr:type IV secretory system conjugative DNA transfer family protein [Acidimicrobiales bacterium]
MDRTATGGSGRRLYVGAGDQGFVLTEPETALLVLGPPRSGKTSAVVVPNVLAAEGPVVSTSTKPDVLAATWRARRKVGRCWVFDPTGSAKLGQFEGGVTELRWSPVTAAHDWDRAVSTARAMVGAARPSPTPAEQHWTERAGALLAPLLHAAALTGGSVSDLATWVDRHDLRPALDGLRAAPGSSPRAVDLIEGIARTDEREASSIWSTASGVLAAYRSGAALASATRPNFDADHFVGTADTVYVCAPASEQATVGTLVAGLLEAVRDARYRLEAEAAGGPAVVLALDEAANIAPLPELPSVVSEGGGQGVLTLACFQDLSQARWRWGRRAEGFLTLFGAKLVLPGVSDPATLDALSTVAGDEEVDIRSRTSAGWRRPGSTTWSTRSQRRLPPDVVRRGRPGSALLVEGAAEPAWVRLTPWHREPVWADLAAGGSSRDRSHPFEAERGDQGWQLG